MSKGKALDFESNDIVTTIERKPGCIVGMKIVVSPKLSQLIYNQALKSVRKEISYPGFRKGKAPEDVVKKMFATHVDKEWRQELKQFSALHAIKSENVTLFDKQNPRVVSDLKQASLETESIIEIEFEAEPELPSISLEDLDLQPIKVPEVTAEDIHNRIESLQLYYAPWEDIVGRGVQEGDYVDLDIESSEKPGLFFCENQRFLFKEKRIPQWLIRALNGKNVGDSFEVVTENEDLSEAEKEEEVQPEKCRITLRAIKSTVLPEVDEAFAKKVGTQNVDDLHDKVREELSRKFSQDARTDFRMKICNQLLDTYQFECPQTFRDAEEMRQKQILDKLLGYPSTAEQMDEKFQHAYQSVGTLAERECRLFFLLQKIAKDQHITFNRDELLAELNVIAQQNENGSNEKLDVSQMSHEAYRNVLNQKIFALLEDIAQKKR